MPFGGRHGELTPKNQKIESDSRSFSYQLVGNSKDMHASYDTLFAKAKGVLKQDPLSGHLFVFINSRRSSIKCLFYDGTGLAILSKRMEQGVFSRINPMHPGELILTAAEFALFFE